MKGYFKYSYKDNSILCFPISIHQLFKIFSKDDLKIKIISAFFIIYQNDDKENNYLSESDLKDLMSLKDIIQKITLLKDYSIDELKFEIVSNDWTVSIRDEEIVTMVIPSPNHLLLIVKQILKIMGFKKVDFLYKKIIKNDSKYVCIDEDSSIFEIFDDFSTLSKETKIFI